MMPYSILLIKILLVCLFAILTRGTIPRYRIDQLISLNWKFFLYFWFIFLMITVLAFVFFF